MNQEEVWREFATLPYDAQQQVIDFITFLRSRYGQPRAIKEGKQTVSLAGEAFVGMWRDREDMQDSGVWVRSAREREWAGAPGRDD